MRLSRKSNLKRVSRELPVGARQEQISGEVHSASSMLKYAVGITGATVTSPRLLRQFGCEVDKAHSARSV